MTNKQPEGQPFNKPEQDRSGLTDEQVKQALGKHAEMFAGLNEMSSEQLDEVPEQSATEAPSLSEIDPNTVSEMADEDIYKELGIKDNNSVE